MSIKRRTIFNNGTQGDVTPLNAQNTYEPHASFDRHRLTTDTDEYFGTYDPTARYFRVSVIIRKLQIDDTGVYSCDYHNITKAIRVIVFKQAHSSDIEFPVGNIKRVKLNKSIPFACRVKEVYPSASVSFILPDNNKVTKVNKTDQSIKNKTVYYFTETSAMNYAPKYSDHNKNMTCSVFTIGSSNLTVDKTLLLNVEGFSLTEKCDKYFTGGVNDLDVEYSCTYFANPKIVPDWMTEERPTKLAIDGIKKIATENVDKLASKVNDGEVTVPAGMSLDGVKEGVKVVAEKAKDMVRISMLKNDKSNYVSSVEDLGDGLYRASLRIKQVALSDYKEYTMVFSSQGSNDDDTEHVVNLRKTGFVKMETLDGSSASFLSSSFVHSISAITITSLLIRLSR